MAPAAAGGAVTGTGAAIRSYFDVKKKQKKFKTVFAEFMEIVESLESILKHLKRACEKLQTQPFKKLETKIVELFTITALLGTMKTLPDQANVCQQVLDQLKEIKLAADMLSIQ